MSKSRRDMLELLCDLTDGEVIDRARTAAHAQEELVMLEGVKKTWMNAHGEQVKAQAGLAARMSTCVRTGKEKRLVDCITFFHTPVVGTKRTVRMDTGEIHREEVMTQHELQDNLFEQVEEEPTAGDAVAGASKDELYDDAVRLVFEFGKGSTSLLQRRLRIGYVRAAGLLDMMERAGLIAAASGSTPREIIGADPDAAKPAATLPLADSAICGGCDSAISMGPDGWVHEDADQRGCERAEPKVEAATGVGYASDGQEE